MQPQRSIACSVQYTHKYDESRKVGKSVLGDPCAGQGSFLAFPSNPGIGGGYSLLIWYRRAHVAHMDQHGFDGFQKVWLMLGPPRTFDFALASPPSPSGRESVEPVRVRLCTAPPFPLSPANERSPMTPKIQSFSLFLFPLGTGHSLLLSSAQPIARSPCTVF
jgi:hypothetical protein